MTRLSPARVTLPSCSACSTEKSTRGAVPVSAFVDEDRTASQQVAVTLERHVDHRVEQRMAGADEGGKRLAERRDQRLLESDALVARQHRLADPASDRGCG